jgi:hypothetical protein
VHVSDMAHPELFTAQADETLDEAADRMSWHQVGTLPVDAPFPTSPRWSCGSPAEPTMLDCNSASASTGHLLPPMRAV